MTVYIGQKPCGHIAAAWIADGTPNSLESVGRMFDAGLLVLKITTEEPVRIEHCNCQLKKSEFINE